MYLKLRILFTILSAVCLAALMPLGYIFGFFAVLACSLGAALFFGLMLLCKQSQENVENQNSTEKEPDFFHPNEEINEKK